jgi:hypothetical protein
MKYPLVYGGISGSIIIAVLILGLTLELPSHFQSEWFGYLVMLAALSMIFVGVKRYRDVECGGVIRFGRAFGLGLCIALVAAAIYIVVWEIFLAASGTDFMAQYQATTLANMRASGASAQEIADTSAMMELWGERYQNPLWRIPITFVEIFPVGFVVALVSAALLRNPRLLPARAG